jgi:hypothetical protein
MRTVDIIVLVGRGDSRDIYTVLHKIMSGPRCKHHVLLKAGSVYRCIVRRRHVDMAALQDRNNALLKLA